MITVSPELSLPCHTAVVCLLELVYDRPGLKCGLLLSLIRLTYYQKQEYMLLFQFLDLVCLLIIDRPQTKLYLIL